jgi:hypothetical protein
LLAHIFFLPFQNNFANVVEGVSLAIIAFCSLLPLLVDTSPLTIPVAIFIFGFVGILVVNYGNNYSQ